MVIGLGSGQASAMAIEYLGRQLRVGAFRDVVGIPTWVFCSFILPRIKYLFLLGFLPQIFYFLFSFSFNFSKYLCSIWIFQLNVQFSFGLFLCRCVASASEAAKAGIPLDYYQDSSQVCTNFKHLKDFLFTEGLRVLHVFKSSPPC